MTKRLLMLSSHMGSRDGIHTAMYEEGQEYDLSLYLAAIFLKEEWAREVAADAVPLETPKQEYSTARAAVMAQLPKSKWPAPEIRRR